MHYLVHVLGGDNLSCFKEMFNCYAPVGNLIQGSLTNTMQCRGNIKLIDPSTIEMEPLVGGK